jgi:hypothetical protein
VKPVQPAALFEPAGPSGAFASYESLGSPAPAAPAHAAAQPEPSGSASQLESPGPAGQPEPSGPAYFIGGGAGLIAAHDGGDRLGDVYGSAFPAFVFDFETRFPSGWFFNAAGEYGSASGHEVLITGEESTTELGLLPAHFSVGKLIDLAPDWQLAVGGGVTISTYREVNDIVASDGTRVGGHGLGGVRWNRNRWSLNGTLRYTWVPDGLEDRAGGQEVVERYDLGYLTLAFTAQYRIWPHGSGDTGEARDAAAARAGEGMASRDRFRVLIYGSGVLPTADYDRPLTRVRSLHASVDPSLGLGAGLHARLSGPLGVGFDAVFSEAQMHGRLEYPYANTTFYADGDLNQKMLTLGLDLHLLDHQAVDLYAGPLVSYLSYDGEVTGEYTSTVDRHGYAFGLGVGADFGRGRWLLHAAFKHLSVARISGFETGFNLRPVLLSFGWGFRF